MTSDGEVWFNWVDGMPAQGTVTIEYASSSEICCTFAMAVEKPDSDQIGTVRLNGFFKYSASAN